MRLFGLANDQYQLVPEYWYLLGGPRPFILIPTVLPLNDQAIRILGARAGFEPA